MVAGGSAAGRIPLMTKTKTAQPDSPPSGDVLGWLTERRPAMIEQVRELVVRESPTHDKAACDALCAYLAEQFRALGGKLKVHRQGKAGDHLQVDFAGARGRQPVLLLGHYDTVYELGTLQSMPWRESGGRLYGPGVFDMKGGIVQVMFALNALQEVNGALPRPLTVWLVSDEETGSDSSRALTEKLAAKCAAALVCEPAGPGGTLKTARKGVGDFRITVTGKAAHAGLDFDKGHSAVLELSHQIQAVSRLTDLKRGITLNPGVIRGGTRTNVIAGEAVAEVDLRVARKSDGPRMERRVKALRSVNRRCQLLIEGGINRPPLERTKEVAALFHTAQRIALGLGFAVGEIAVGGGSDGNFTAGIGVPTLDGLGAVGDGAHACHEYVVAAELSRRAALLAGLIAAI
jgi:glutamate carboxypeptidase